jgi:molecular chaperone DnaK
MGGPVVSVPLVTAGEQLPKRGKQTFRAETAVYAGSDDHVLRFKLWEGEIQDRITENRLVGSFEITGGDLVDGYIPVGAELICHYEVLDSGEIHLDVEIPTASARIGSRDKGKNFYTRRDAAVDYSDPDSVTQIFEERRDVENEIATLESQVSDHRLDQAREKLEALDELASTSDDPEAAKQSMDSVAEARRYLAEVRQEYRWTLLKVELDNVRRYFDEHCREHAQPTEEAAFDNLVRTTSRAIESGQTEAESYVEELWSQIRTVLWRQPWWIQSVFESWSARPGLFQDPNAFAALKAEGREAMARGDINQLRSVVYEMGRLFRPTSTDADAQAAANIILA